MNEPQQKYKNLTTKAVVFDFDYTLVDSSQGIIFCLNSALEKIGQKSVDEDLIKKMIGLSLSDMFTKATGIIDPEIKKQFLDSFNDIADEVMNDQTIIYSKVPSILMNLKRRGIKMGIVSNKYRYRIQDFLVKKGLLSLFFVIVGGEDAKSPKPDPEGLAKAIAVLGLDPNECIFVGDSTVDAKTAENAGVPFVAVLSGITGRDDFLDHETIAVIRSLDEILRLCS